MSENSMSAMYYISLFDDAKENSDEQERLEWRKANQNRLNQNFAAVARELDALRELLSAGAE